MSHGQRSTASTAVGGTSLCDMCAIGKYAVDRTEALRQLRVIDNDPQVF
jgi:hypothetical protein